MIEESSNIRTFVFEDRESVGSQPGQFSMIWLPRVGEFPMSICLPFGGDKTSITVKAMGEGSRALYDCKKGDVIGVRGPYGNSFDLSKKMRNVLLVGGGTGMAPMIVLAGKFASAKSTRASIVIGARTKDEMAFLKLSRKYLRSGNVYPTTDDGSLGFKGFAHEQVRDLVKKRKFGTIFSCGPEPMMKAVYEIAKANRIPVQFSLERIMKCGIGICGSCCLGDIVLCRDGPVLNGQQLERVSKEFGSVERDKAGRLVPK